MDSDNIVARIDATFENTLHLDAELESVYQVETNKVLSNTTEGWNSQPELVTKEGYLYVYTDYKQNEDQQDIAGFKFGDGTSLLIDLPFSDDIIYEEIEKIEDDMRDTSIDGAIYHLGFYLDENGGLCQVNSIGD